MIKYVLAFTIVLSSISGTCQRNVKIESTPAWVEAIDYNPEVSDTLNAGGSYDLLFERQYNIPSEESYIRYAIKVLTEKGLESSSYISINFDPSFQTLVFHKVIVKRGTQVINKVSNNHFEVIRREQNMDRLIYDKSLDAILNLDDVQVGDIIEYAYTIKGYNPVFDNKFAKTIYLEYGAPVGKIFVKLNTPSERTLQFKSFNDAPDPVKAIKGKLTTYSWDLEKVP